MRSQLLLLALTLFPLSGCSVYMASHGSEAKDTSVLKLGAPRPSVEAKLGSPIGALSDETPETIVTYQFFTGDDPSSKRAVVYGLLDVVTLGLSELIFTPVEALQGDKHIIEVRYDKHGKLKESNSYILKAPIDKPEKFFGLDDSEEAPQITKAERKSKKAFYLKPVS